MKYLIEKFKKIIHSLKGTKIFALIGKSGTGKSFRAQLIAEKYMIDLIIDDGLLIERQKIIAGKSAKLAETFISAVKTAIFEDKENRNEVKNAILKNRSKKILILGTSYKMIKNITKNLKLSLPNEKNIIYIENIATETEIKTALSHRKKGNHVIPVPMVNIDKKYSQIIVDNVKIFFSKKILHVFKKKNFIEKTIVKPQFSGPFKTGNITISNIAIYQMINHCIYEYTDNIKVLNFSVKFDEKLGYKIKVFISIPYKFTIEGGFFGLQRFILNKLVKYGELKIIKLDLIIDEIYNKKDLFNK